MTGARNDLRRPLVVAALGGNALLRRGEPLDIVTQRVNVAHAANALASLASRCDLAIVHGNGPQVGLLALDSSAGPSPMPLDVLDAESQGQVGYLLQAALANTPVPPRVATLLTQVEVDIGDPAFAHPTKPIGPVYRSDDAARLGVERGWSMAPDGGGQRRVVASPEPRRILELDVIRLLLQHGIVVICAGGGGIPVARDGDELHGVEAVVDKDLTAALLAIELGADCLLLLTDVDGVYVTWPADQSTPLTRCTPTDLRRLDLAPGSMGPKAEAAARFVEATGQRAVITSLEGAVSAFEGTAGTIVE